MHGAVSETASLLDHHKDSFRVLELGLCCWWGLILLRLHGGTAHPDGPARASKQSQLLDGTSQGFVAFRDSSLMFRMAMLSQRLWLRGSSRSPSVIARPSPAEKALDGTCSEVSLCGVVSFFKGLQALHHAILTRHPSYRSYTSHSSENSHCSPQTCPLHPPPNSQVYPQATVSVPNPADSSDQQHVSNRLHHLHPYLLVRSPRLHRLDLPLLHRLQLFLCFGLAYFVP